MWGRGRNRANPGMESTWGRSSSNKGMGSTGSLCITHDRTALGSGRGGSGDSGGGRRSSSGGRAKVRPAVCLLLYRLNLSI